MSQTTPFAPVHEKLGAVFADYYGWSMPHYFADETTEMNALYSASAVFDLSNFGRITLKGSGAKSTLDRLLATNLDELYPDSWIWAVVCSEQGTVIDIVRVAHIKNTYTIFTSPAKRQMVFDLARQFAADTTVDSITDKTGMLALYGPTAFDAISRILPFDIEHLDIGDAESMSFFMMPITIIRGGFVGTDGMELICPKAAAAMAASAISKYREKEGITPVGSRTLESAMIHAALPASIINTPKGCKLSPTTLGLMNMVDLGKDFNGKDAVARAAAQGTSQTLVGIKTPKGDTHTVLTIQYDDAEIGFSPKLVPSDKLDANIGLAVVNADYADFDSEVQIIAADLVIGGEIVALPFTDVEPVRFAK